jgi:hypothetical protein
MSLTQNKHSKIPSDIPSFNISDLGSPQPSNMIFCPSSLNFPCGLDTIRSKGGMVVSSGNREISYIPNTKRVLPNIRGNNKELFTVAEEDTELNSDIENQKVEKFCQKK